MFNNCPIYKTKTVTQKETRYNNTTSIICNHCTVCKAITIYWDIQNNYKELLLSLQYSNLDIKISHNI